MTIVNKKNIVGKVFPTKKSGYVTVMDYINSSNVVIKFEDNTIKNVILSNLKKGQISNWVNKPKPGDVYPTNNCGLVKIIEYVNFKNVKILFENGIIKTVQLQHLKKGLVRNKLTYPEIKQHYSTNNYGIVTVIKYKNKENVLIKFDDGTLSTVRFSNLKRGEVKNPSISPSSPIKLGNVYQTNNCGIVEVIEYISNREIKVRFEDGNIATVIASNLRTGMVRNPSYKPKPGDIYKTNRYGNVTVIRYYNSKNVLIRFIDGITKSVAFSQLKTGMIRNPSSY